jgi:tetratricopeptide (TPR) repeat protein
MDAKFDAYMQKRFAAPLALIKVGEKKGGEPDEPNAFVVAMRQGSAFIQQKQLDSARSAFVRAQQLFPQYAGPRGPAWYLANMAKTAGNWREAADQIAKITSLNAVAYDANMFEADVRQRLGDTTGVKRALERLIWIYPYELTTHELLANAASGTRDYKLAIRERRAIVALDPPDKLDARYQLARALVDGGDIAGARRELLSMLEQAPSFEKAQTLLLEIRNRNTPGGSR